MNAITLKKGKEMPVKKEHIKLISVSKESTKSTWRFEKKQYFLPICLDLLLRLGFTKEDPSIKYFFGISQNEDEKGIDVKTIQDPYNATYLPVALFRDELIFIQNKGYDIELIFFEKSIILVIRTSLKHQRKIGSLIAELYLI